MNIFSQAFTWLNDPLNWTNPNGIVALLGEHMYLSGLAIALACLVSWQIGRAHV